MEVLIAMLCKTSLNFFFVIYQSLYSIKFSPNGRDTDFFFEFNLKIFQLFNKANNSARMLVVGNFVVVLLYETKRQLKSLLVIFFSKRERK